MVSWFVDEGIAKLRTEWRVEHPGAVVFTIGDQKHDTDPDKSQHAPDDGGSQPGDDRGEVDAGDFMPGNGVTEADLDDLFHALIETRDPRILMLIRRDKIVSSVVQPWVIRPYPGKYHYHTHVSVNDRYDNNTSDWKWEDEVARTLTYTTIEGKLPELQTGDEDSMFPGWNHIGRFQAALNHLEKSLPPIDEDGVYGAKSAAKLTRLMAKVKVRSSTNGSKVREPEWRTLYGLSK